MDEVCNTKTPLVVTRQNARSVVMVSEDDYEGLMETVRLLRAPANAMRLLEAIRQADSGDLSEMELVQPQQPDNAA
jgi:antitoxin YefM